MYSLLLTCDSAEVDRLSGELWELGTAGIRELELGDQITLIAGFETNTDRENLLRQFAAHSPEWELEETIDWIQWTHESWPDRLVGRKLYLATPWSEESTPKGRIRLIHNPGLACGTGEHPCTQLALSALEDCLKSGDRVLDVGTGSGILAIASRLLGASFAVGADLDTGALSAAQENYSLNDLLPTLYSGSAEAVGNASFDVVVANINASVLLTILEDLLRVSKEEGRLILTGFTAEELARMLQLFPSGSVTELNEWRCLTACV